ncbi:uncharacterized protein BDR25DRAFT_50767 [Lindgomyces ingoldianus]|uniref:Uncharacterized protein n=1 Tax=Lindgomyces ingoldianus TaxID=673940 RepID=A0ACB6QSF8_9PLEO|nr:uncharacterized protein BDR25DRAFT_50767 [Lindgomyces ingoldianus]KAF2469040.1 hypothetical protein BDR25DRAFT_50767 [Lindgomyces ingoldianus]
MIVMATDAWMHPTATISRTQWWAQRLMQLETGTLLEAGIPILLIWSKRLREASDMCPRTPALHTPVLNCPHLKLSRIAGAREYRHSVIHADPLVSSVSSVELHDSEFAMAELSCQSSPTPCDTLLEHLNLSKLLYRYDREGLALPTLPGAWVRFPPVGAIAWPPVSRRNLLGISACSFALKKSRAPGPALSVGSNCFTPSCNLTTNIGSARP